MRYDFDTITERKNTRSTKWDNVGVRVGNADALPMWVADMDFRCPEPVVEAVRKRAEHGIYGYVFVTDEFSLATRRWMKLRHDWDIAEAKILYASGTMPILHAAVQAFTLPGEKVIIQRPVYYPFTTAIEGQGRQLADNALMLNAGRYEIDFENLQKLARDPDVKLMLLCNPHNPVGRVFDEGELRKIGEICIENNIVIVSDEIHSDFIFRGSRHIPIASLSADMAAITITAVSPSKTFNLAGLNTAAAIIFEDDIASKIEQVQAANRSAPVSAFGLDAYIAAYSQGEEYLRQLLEYLEQNSRFLEEYLVRYMPKIKLIPPEGTYLMWLDCRELGLSKNRLDEFFTHKAAVALDMGGGLETREPDL